MFGNRRFLVLGFLSIIVFLNGCTPKTIDLSNSNKLVYRFKDASVPPEYHRSYTITVTRSDAKIVVDSYGTILNKADVKINEKQFEEIIEAIKSNKIAVGSSSAEDGCTGGTTESLRVLKGDEISVFDASVYHCGSRETGNLKGDIGQLANKLKVLFPDFDTLVKPK